jgi:hypothetical protein
LAQCDKILANKGKKGHEAKKPAGGMNEAVSGTEAIRQWNDHRIGTAKLAEKFETNAIVGLTTDKARQKHGEVGNNSLSKKV